MPDDKKTEDNAVEAEEKPVKAPKEETSDKPAEENTATDNSKNQNKEEIHSQNRKKVLGLIEDSDKEKQTADLQDQADFAAEYHYRQTMRAEQEKRTEEITKIFVNYRGQQEQRYEYKHNIKPKIIGFLFRLIIALVVLLAAFSIILICVQEIEGPSVVALVTGFVTCLGSVLSILVIIVKYIFPEDEDKNFNDLVTSIITNDTVRIKDENDYRLHKDK
ncbi:MAG: hypothetical protein IJ514_02205 [Clostridia bacterium]|nr:hypothetical protein [Clostridia bacterium]